jgi:hypothetical protein
MVLNADARRTAAVNRLAKWADRAERWGGANDVGWEFPGATFARRRKAAAERYVAWVAGRDVAAGRLDVDLAAHRVPTEHDDRRTAHYLAAAAAYNLAAVRAATDLIDAARRPGSAAEGVRRAPGPAALPDDDHDRGR